MLASESYYDGQKAHKASSSATSAYLLIIVSVLVKCVGYFMVGDLLQSMHVMTLLCGVQICASLILVPLQKPFAGSSSAPKMGWSKVFQLSIFNMLVQTLFFYAITLCGPLRAILIFEIPSGVISTAIAAITRQPKGSPARTRGTALLIVGLLSLCLLDADASFTPHPSIDGRHAGLSHIWGVFTDYVRLADHHGGIVVLIVALTLRAGYEHAFKRLSVEYGGPKRVHSAVHLCGAIVSIPFAVIVHFVGPTVMEAHGRSTLWLIGHMLLVAICIRIAGFYADTHVQASKTANNQPTAPRWMAAVLTYFGSVLMARIWYAHVSVEALNDSAMPMHGLSAGVVITVMLFALATIVLSRSNIAPKNKSQILDVDGYGLTGKTVFRPGEAFFSHTSISITDFARSTMQHIWARSDSRTIFYFLIVNLAFCGVEFAYGIWTNSLGLVSDAFHMLFDCLSLVMGLVASVMAGWATNRHYSYGFGRVEVLSGFINALFLIVIAFTIFMAALGRLVDPPTVHTDKLLLVSVAGLLINLFGMFSLHGSHGHSHGGGGDHGHSHGGSNANMYGMYLHVMADAGGSVAVIISTLLLEYFGWKWVDPLCSLLLAMLIIGSVIPPIQDAFSVLMQCSPGDTADKLHTALENINHIAGVQSYSAARCWQLNGELTVASVHVQVTHDASPHAVAQKVAQELQSVGAENVTVQVEKDAFFHKIHQIYPSYSAPSRTHRPLHESVMTKAI